MINYNIQNYDVSNSRRTQIVSTYKTYNKLTTIINRFERVLDYGSGLSLGAKVLNERGFHVETYEPYPKREGIQPDYTNVFDVPSNFDFIISNYVLNVLPEMQRLAVLKQMWSRLKIGGKLFINVRSRSSILNTKSPLEYDNNTCSVITSRGTYQKGFSSEELRYFIKENLEYSYIESSKIGGVSCIVTRLA